jgi:hypothetical protein
MAGAEDAPKRNHRETATGMATEKVILIEYF